MLSDLLRELDYTGFPCGVNALGDRAPSRTTNVDHHHDNECTLTVGHYTPRR